MDWNLSDHSEKRTFKIPVGNMSKEEFEKLINKYFPNIRMKDRRKKLDKIIEKIDGKNRNNCNNS